MKIMNLERVLIVFFLIITGLCKAQDSLNAPKKSKVIFLRSTGLAGSGAFFKTFIDGELVCKLNNRKYSVHEVPVGNHECSVSFGGLKINEKAERNQINVEENKITYVEFFMKNEIISYRIYGKEITQDEAKKKLKKMKEDVKCL
ncbi:hypothetical protein [Flavobacterium ginsengiterrae]|uniref:DUF2846 domain-containing protein n=1 Tax=Flavobacterium ginsengiterrae TaxID=871695 RepID=A0ABP7G657_9FLAO